MKRTPTVKKTYLLPTCPAILQLTGKKGGKDGLKRHELASYIGGKMMSNDDDHSKLLQKYDYSETIKAAAEISHDLSKVDIREVFDTYGIPRTNENVGLFVRLANEDIWDIMVSRAIAEVDSMFQNSPGHPAEDVEGAHGYTSRNAKRLYDMAIKALHDCDFDVVKASNAIKEGTFKVYRRYPAPRWMK